MSVSAADAAEQPAAVQIAEAARAVLVPQDAATDGVLTVFDNSLWVQCLSSHYLPGWRCDAAGLRGQPWLHHLMTADREARLFALGFGPDTVTGNFIAQLPRTTTPQALAEIVLRVLTEGYGAKVEDLEVNTARLKTERCHPRIRSGADRGGSILAPGLGFAKDADAGCVVANPLNINNNDATDILIPNGGRVDLNTRYGAAMTAELEKVETAPKGVDAFVIFQAGPAYVQCQHDFDGNRMYCEAVSEDAVGHALARVLTTERKAKLTAAGFEPPGKVMNYWRFYPRPQYDLPAVTKALLDVLKNAYGYQGTPPLTVTTALDKERPL